MKKIITIISILAATLCVCANQAEIDKISFLVNEKQTLGDDAGAKKIIDDALITYPNSIQLLASKLDFLDDNPAEKEKLVNAIITSNPQDAFSIAIIGVVYAYYIKDDAKAKVPVQKVIEMEAKTQYDFFGKAISYDILNDTKSAIEACNKAVELDPKYFIAYAFRLSIKNRLNDIEGAKADAKKLVELNPDSLFALTEDAGVDLRAHDWKSAIAKYEKIVAKYPSYAFAKEMLERTKHIAKAQEESNKAK